MYIMICIYNIIEMEGLQIFLAADTNRHVAPLFPVKSIDCIMHTNVYNICMVHDYTKISWLNIFIVFNKLPNIICSK